MYHMVNTKLCEFLYWYYSEDGREVFIRHKHYCIIGNRGDEGLVVRTFYKSSKQVNQDKYFYLKLQSKEKQYVE